MFKLVLCLSNACNIHFQVLLRRFQISHNLSYDGVLDFLNSKKMTEAGPMDLIEDDNSDEEDQPPSPEKPSIPGRPSEPKQKSLVTIAYQMVDCLHECAKHQVCSFVIV